MDTGQMGQLANPPAPTFPNRASSEAQVSSNEQFPLVTFCDRVLDDLDLPLSDRNVIKKHLDTTTWPSFFLSIEKAREIFANASHPWSDEDDKVLMYLPQVSTVSEEKVNSTFFWHRLPQECQERRKLLRDNYYDIYEDHQWERSHRHIPIASGRDILEELCDMRALMIARCAALVSLRQNANMNASGGNQVVSINTLIHAREALDFAGWPGRYHDIASFKTMPQQSTAAPPNKDIDSLHIVLSSCSNGISWAGLKTVFYPAVSEVDWTKATRSVRVRRKWSDKEVNELKEAVEKDELEEFATSHGRFLGEVELKAQRKFEKRPNRSSDNSRSTDAATPWIVTKRVRRDVPGPPKKKTRAGGTMTTSPIASTSLPASPNVAQSSEVPRDAEMRQFADLTEEDMFEMLQFYISDAYNIVRLVNAGIPLETLRHLKLKGIYNVDQLRQTYEIVSEAWEEVILDSSWWEFEHLFKEAFVDEYVKKPKQNTLGPSLQPQRSPELPNFERLRASMNQSSAGMTLPGAARSQPGYFGFPQTIGPDNFRSSQQYASGEMGLANAWQSQQQNSWMGNAGASRLAQTVSQQRPGFPNHFQPYQFPQAPIQPFQPPALNYAPYGGHNLGTSIPAPAHAGTQSMARYGMHQQAQQQPSQLQAGQTMAMQPQGSPLPFNQDAISFMRMRQQAQQQLSQLQTGQTMPAQPQDLTQFLGDQQLSNLQRQLTYQKAQQRLFGQPMPMQDDQEGTSETKNRPAE